MNNYFLEKGYTKVLRVLLSGEGDSKQRLEDVKNEILLDISSIEKCPEELIQLKDEIYESLENDLTFSTLSHTESSKIISNFNTLYREIKIYSEGIINEDDNQEEMLEMEIEDEDYESDAVRLYHLNPNDYGDEWFVAAYSKQEALKIILSEIEVNVGNSISNKHNLKLFSNIDITNPTSYPYKYTLDEHPIGYVIKSEIA